MTKGQIKKMQGCLSCVSGQLDACLIKFETRADEQIVAHHIRLAMAQIKKASEALDDVRETKPQPNPNYRPTKYMSEPVIPRHDPTIKPTFNLLCRNYTEIRSSSGKVIERGCIVGMDMDFCSKNCAYATNNVCTLKATGKGRPRK